MLTVVDRIRDKRTTDKTSSETQRSTTRHAHATAACLTVGLAVAALLGIPAVTSLLGIPAVALLRGIASVTRLLLGITSSAVRSAISRLLLVIHLLGLTVSACMPAAHARESAAVAAAAAAHFGLARAKDLAEQALGLVLGAWRELVRVGRLGLLGWIGGVGLRASRPGVFFGLELTGESSVFVFVAAASAAGVVVVVVVVGVDFCVDRRGLAAGLVGWWSVGRIIARGTGGGCGLFPLGFLGVCVDVEPGGVDVSGLFWVL